eukprot:11214609-Lingulodinium_polyedra.AAC.1
MGVEAFALVDSDYGALDAVIAAVGRIAMQGQACTRDSTGEVVRSMTSAEVMRFWRIACARTELTARRLAWYQKMVAWKENHVQVICAMFGTCDIEKQVDEEGLRC